MGLFDSLKSWFNGGRVEEVPKQEIMEISEVKPETTHVTTETSTAVTVEEKPAQTVSIEEKLITSLQESAKKDTPKAAKPRKRRSTKRKVK